MKWLSIGTIGTFLDNNLKKFPFWKNKIYRFLIFSLFSLVFSSLLIFILFKNIFFDIFWILIIFALIYGAIATYATNRR